MSGVDSFISLLPWKHIIAAERRRLRDKRRHYNARLKPSSDQGPPMNRLHPTAAALAGFRPRRIRLRPQSNPADHARAVEGDDDRGQQLSVASGGGHGFLRPAPPGEPGERRDHHRLVHQPQRARRAGQADRRRARSGPSRRRACGSRRRARSIRTAPGSMRRFPRRPSRSSRTSS